jgi:predicted small secreted protein
MKHLLPLLLIAAILLTGCEASRGLYRDMEQAGQWITDKVSGSKH